MGKKRRVLQHVSIVLVLLLMLGTFVSFFVAPRIADAKTRRALGLPEDALVTDTARSPWIYVDEEGAAVLYGEKMIGMKTIYVPSAVNGIKVERIRRADTSRAVKTVVLPSTVLPTKMIECFRKWEGLKTLVFSEGTESLSGISIHGMPDVEGVYVPRSITAISASFMGQDGVTVCYAGTEEEWLALGKNAQKLSDRGIVVFEAPFVNAGK